MKIQSPWMGRVKGSAGNMTGSKVYDKNVLRAKAFEVSNPNTTAQQTERSFFAQVADCCASVSEEQLRSLFGVKPKSMSRRNALTKQLSAAFSVNGTIKSFDLSKLEAIGNGVKCNTKLYTIDNYQEEDIDLQETYETLGVLSTSNPNIILVLFNHTKKKISILNTDYQIGDTIFSDSFTGVEIGDAFSFYPTCATDGSNVYGKSFGTFAMKTRTDK